MPASSELGAAAGTGLCCSRNHSLSPCLISPSPPLAPRIGFLHFYDDALEFGTVLDSFIFLSGYLLSGHESITERSRLFLQKYKNTTLTRQIYINNTERSKEYVNAKIKKTQKNINQTKKVQTSLRSVIKNI